MYMNNPICFKKSYIIDIISYNSIFNSFYRFSFS